MSLKQHRKKSKAGSPFRCSKCGTGHSAWEGRCASCGEWDTIVDSTVVRVDSPKRSADVQAVIEKLTATFKPGVARKEWDQSVDILMTSGDVSLKQLESAASSVVAQAGKEIIENPVGYLIASVRNRLGENVVSAPAPTASGWDGLTISSCNAPLTSLKDVVADLEKQLADRRRFRGQQLADEPEEEACKGCAGAGLVLSQRLAPDKAILTQDLEACPLCNRENEEERHVRLLRHSGLRGMLLGMRFENLAQTPDLADAVEAARLFIEGRILQLVLVAPPGRGKTHIAVAALREIIDHGTAGLYLNVARFLDAVRMSYETNAEDQTSDLMRPAMEWPVCILDDFGAHRETSWTVEKLYTIVDNRYGSGLQTIVCSNVSPDSWDPRVLSRLCDRNRGLVVSLPSSVPDYRLKGVPA